MRNSAFDSSTLRVLFFERFRRLSLTVGLKRLVLFASSHSDHPRLSGRMGAFGASGAGLAIGSREADVDHRVLVAILTGHPQDTRSTLRTDRCLLVPVKCKGRDAKAVLCFGLPTWIGIHWSDQCHAMLGLAGHQVVGGHSASPAADRSRHRTHLFLAAVHIGFWEARNSETPLSWRRFR